MAVISLNGNDVIKTEMNVKPSSQVMHLPIFSPIGNVYIVFEILPSTRFVFKDVRYDFSLCLHRKVTKYVFFKEE